MEQSTQDLLNQYNAKIAEDERTGNYGDEFIYVDKRSRLLGQTINYSDYFLQEVNAGQYGQEFKEYLGTVIGERIPTGDVSNTNPELVLHSLQEGSVNYDPGYWEGKVVPYSDDYYKQNNIPLPGETVGDSVKTSYLPYFVVGGLVLLVVMSM